MATFRLINQVRLDGNYGTHTGNQDYHSRAPPRYRTVEQMRPQVYITPEEARMTAPPPPTTPKPPPPERPSRVRPPPMMPPATNDPNPSRDENRRTLRSLSADFHPPLRPISQLTPNHLAVPITTRTGIVHPPLPVDVSNQYEVPSSSLRTTPEGIRLEITPAAMVQRLTPEETRSDPAASSSSRSSSPTPSLPPELDPEA